MMLLLRWLTVVGIFLTVLFFVSGSIPAQDNLAPGSLLIDMNAGFKTYGDNSYCLPVANWGLGRQTAAGYNLEWQLASNYSTVPFFVSIQHRQAIALKGSVEVISHQPYYAEESDPGHRFTVIKDFVAPPGKELVIALAPRVAPRATPGSPLNLTARIIIGNSEHIEHFSSTQLEPAHVYSLLLGSKSALDPPRVSTVNSGNHLQIKLPSFMLAAKSEPYLGIKSFNHYLLTVDRTAVTTLPLAARDFAFVCVDAVAARTWPLSEQEALAQYVVGGGHLCFFNVTEAPWLTAFGDLSTRPIGRGWLLAESGDLQTAEFSMNRWLEGELEEISLWLYGRAAESQLYREIPDAGQVFGEERANRLLLDLSQLYVGSSPSHEPGYLHPIWLYREVCNPGAVEPWDYPEFTAAYKLARPANAWRASSPLLQNWNFSQLLNNRQPSIRPMHQLAQPDRPQHATREYLAATLLLALTTAIAGATRTRGLAGMALVPLAVAVLGIGAWIQLTPVDVSESELTLIDADASCTGGTKRILAARPVSNQKRAELTCGELVRYFRGTEPGNVTIKFEDDRQTDSISTLNGFAAGDFVVAASDTALTMKELDRFPVRLWATRHDQELAIHVDTTGLKAGTVAILYTPDGPEVVTAGLANATYRLRLPIAPLNLPHAGRLLAWRGFYQQSRTRGFRGLERDRFVPWFDAPDPYGVLRLALTQPGYFSSDALSQLGWVGLLQPVGGVRAFTTPQCYLICQLSAERHRVEFLRLSMPLAGWE